MNFWWSKIIALILPVLTVAPVAAGPGAPYVIVLGVAQDGGVPQAGSSKHPGWDDPSRRRYVVSLALVDGSQRWLFECTPDFPEQLQALDSVAPAEGRPGLAGIFLTHAHIGHYTGLMYLGHEVMGAADVPVYAMPRMADYLEGNGPWSQLVKYHNIKLRAMTAGESVRLNDRITVEPFLVPHRQEFSEVAGFIINGPNRSVLFIPDIDSWEEWDAQGTRIEDMIARVDIAYLDATFFDGNEMPGRDMSGFLHPFIRHSMDRFKGLSEVERKKVRFIHFNHTNPVLFDKDVQDEIGSRGFNVAEEMERFDL